MHTKGGSHKRRSVETARVLLFKGPQARRCTHQAAHTQGGTHKRRPVATAGFMLVWGPQARRCTHKAKHTKRGMWPPWTSFDSKDHRQGGSHTRRNTQKAACGHRRSHVSLGATGNAVQTQGNTHKRRPVATARVLLFKGPQARWCTHKAKHTKGGMWPQQESC